MSELEQYYNEEIRGADYPEFNELSEQQRKRIKDSLGFAGYSSKKAMLGVREAVALEAGKTVEQISDKFRKAMKKAIVMKQEWKKPQE